MRSPRGIATSCRGHGLRGQLVVENQKKKKAKLACKSCLQRTRRENGLGGLLGRGSASADRQAMTWSQLTAAADSRRGGESLFTGSLRLAGLAGFRIRGCLAVSPKDRIQRPCLPTTCVETTRQTVVRHSTGRGACATADCARKYVKAAMRAGPLPHMLSIVPPVGEMKGKKKKEPHTESAVPPDTAGLFCPLPPPLPSLNRAGAMETRLPAGAIAHCREARLT